MMKQLIGALGAAVLLSISAGAEDLNARIAAVAESGGGKVSVSGVTRMEGPLELKSGVELHLEDGAEIVFSGDPKRYSHALVMARDAKDVAITGKGTFRANVDYWHSAEGYRNPRPQFFQFSGCRNLRLEGFRVRESPSWTIHVYDTKDVVIRNLDVIAHGRNTDGIDIDSTENVLIENCRLDQGDDGFVMKSGKNAEGRRRGKPTRNVTIRNCTVVNGHTLLGIGSELSGGIENIRLENCTVEGEVWRVLLVKTNPARGGYARDIHVKGVKAARAKCAVFEIMEDYFWWREQKTDPEIVRTAISDVSVEDVVCDEAWYAYDLRGDAALKPRDIAIRNCTVKNPVRDAGRAENVENLTVENVTAKTGPVTVWCNDADARYRCGDTATFTVHATTNCTAHVRLDNFGEKVINECDVKLEKGRDFTLTGGRDIPGFLLLTVSVGKTTVRWGAAFDPEKITAGAACPDDFDEFWREAIAKYDREVPVDVKLEPLPQLSTNGCDVSLVSLSDPKGRTVYGFLSVPQGRKGPFPARMHIPGAGPSVGLPFCGDRETIGLTMNVHYYRPVPGEAKRGKVHNALQAKEDAEWQAKYPAAKPRYTVSGIAANREDYFYYGAFLAINRAANWLWNRPDVRRDDFSYSGGSQGGGSGLALLALNGRFTRAAIHVPALTAHLCQTIDGREAGWPRLVESQLPENRAAAARNAPYFDGVNFASRVTCPIRFSVGFTDTVAPPHAGYAAFNACPSKDKAMVDSVGFGHANSKVDSARIKRWFAGAEDAQSPRISVFAKFVRNTAKERGISLAEAADWLYDIGVRGVDAGPGEKDLDALAATKLRIINFYFFPHMFDEAKCDEDIRFCLGQARKYAVPRVMVVPSGFTKDGDEEAEFEKDLAAMKKFVAAAKAQGIETTVEDFGGTANPCSHVKYLKRFLDEIPDLKFAADSGNLYYAGRGEDILEMLAYARGRVGHVHLKDQSREDNRRYVSLGLGAVPNEKLVKAVNASGYGGWYTLENPVGDTFEDTVRQISVLKSWLSGK